MLRDTFDLDNASLRLSAKITPWDTECFGFRVAQIDHLERLAPDASATLLAPFMCWLEENCVRLVSVRLRSNRARESMLLEANGFRFIEIVLHPHHDLPYTRHQDQGGLVIEAATTADIPAIHALACNAFPYGRIHADPRLGPELGNRRYGRWVASTLAHSRQRLMKVLNTDAAIVAFFVIEAHEDMSIHWHLTAMSPAFQRQGLGWRVWLAMLAHHARDGMRAVHTTITAANVPVLNLYSKLGFRFMPPEMTFHWMREPAP